MENGRHTTQYNALILHIQFYNKKFYTLERFQFDIQWNYFRENAVTTNSCLRVLL